MTNKSEKQLKKFIKFHKKEITNFTLSPQGDSTMISEKSINLCKAYTNEKVYYFGGISENFYDKMYVNFFINKKTDKLLRIAPLVKPYKQRENENKSK